MIARLFRTGTIFIGPVALAACLVLGAQAALAQSIEGTATYRERMALPAGAVLDIALEDVSRADAPAETIARAQAEATGAPPFAFTLVYDPARIRPERRYVVRATLRAGETILFVTDTVAPVMTQGSPDTVALVLRRAGTSATAEGGGASAPAASPALADTYWRAVELLGKPTPPARAATREAHVQFLADGRVSGSDGCNRIAGSYELTGDAITFGQMLGTQMACPDSTGTERPFRDALARAARVTVTIDRLELFDTAGTRVAAFAARDASAAFTVPGR